MSDDLEILHQAMRRAALRLVVAARGRHADVDAALENLRHAMLDNTEAKRVNDATDALGRALLVLDDDAGTPGTATGPDQSHASARPATGWLGRLLGRQPEPAGEPGHSEARADTVIVIRDRLTALASGLSLPSEYGESLESLQRGLEAAESPESVAERVDELADLLLTANETENAELEAFLLQLSQRLGDLHALLQSESSLTAEADSDDAMLDDAVRKHVDAIQSALQQAKDPHEAHRLVSSDLDALAREVAAYRQTRDERRQQARQHNEALAGQLQAAEQESQRLRAALAEETRRAREDQLTGVGNRDVYEERIREEIERSTRQITPLSLLVIDIDGFKPVNDTHGHAAGDQVLRQLASLLRESTRVYDTLARYGGEEFTLILPGSSLAQARELGERLRGAVADAVMSVDGKTVTITVSIGVAEAGRGEAPESLFRRADRALYRAKEAGRNRVVADG